MRDVLIVFAHSMAVAEQIIPLGRLAGYSHNTFCDIAMYHKGAVLWEHLRRREEQCIVSLRNTSTTVYTSAVGKIKLKVFYHQTNPETISISLNLLFLSLLVKQLSCHVLQ